MKKIMLGALFAGAFFATAGSAEAGLQLCNKTSFKVQFALGYKNGTDISGAEEWVAKGWWKLEPGECLVPGPVRGDLSRRYYYYYAEEVGGSSVWASGGSGKAYLFCTDKKAFTLPDGGCDLRGYDEHPFRSIDAGNKKNHTVNLIE